MACMLTELQLMRWSCTETMKMRILVLDISVALQPSRQMTFMITSNQLMGTTISKTDLYTEQSCTQNNPPIEMLLIPLCILRGISSTCPNFAGS